MNDKPLVSILVITYNRKVFLHETIESILNQTYKNFEIIIVDNFSNYDFLSYMNSFKDDNVKSWSYFNNQTYDEDRISNENPFPPFLENNN